MSHKLVTNFTSCKVKSQPGLRQPWFSESVAIFRSQWQVHFGACLEHILQDTLVTTEWSLYSPLFSNPLAEKEPRRCKEEMAKWSEEWEEQREEQINQTVRERTCISLAPAVERSSSMEGVCVRVYTPNLILLQLPPSLDTQLSLLKFIPVAKCPAFQLWFSYHLAPKPVLQGHHVQFEESVHTYKWLKMTEVLVTRPVWIESSNNCSYKHPGPVENCTTNPASHPRLFVFKASLCKKEMIS